MKIINFLLCALLTVNAKSGNHNSKHHSNGSKRILGKELSIIRSYPSQVAIEQKIRWGVYKFMCGGSIISQHHILTSSHCAVDKLRIKLGTDFTTNLLAQTKLVLQSNRHPEFEEQGTIANNDISILKLQSAIRLNSRIGTVDLAQNDWEPKVPNATVVGWGVGGIFPTSGFRLKKADVIIIENDECERVWYNLGLNVTINDTHICTLGKGVSEIACNGDFSVRLFQNALLVGIGTWNIAPCDISGAPFIYTRVSKFVDWISGKVKE